MSRRLVTADHGFHHIGGGPLFSVNPGMPLADALEQASNLMECVERLTLIIGSDAPNLPHGLDAFAAHYLAEMAKALVDACASGTLRSGGAQ